MNNFNFRILNLMPFTEYTYRLAPVTLGSYSQFGSTSTPFTTEFYENDSGRAFPDVNLIKRRILNNFDFKLMRNEKIGIIGINGVGKSTFLKLVSGQIKTDFGVPVVYLGFGILIISIFLSYVSYTQFWFSQKSKRCLPIYRTQ